MNHYTARRVSLHMRAPCINSGAKVRGGTKRHTGRSFYEKPTGRLCEGRKRGLSLVRNAGRILGIVRIQSLRHAGGLSLLSYESTFSLKKKKRKKKKKEKNLQARRANTLRYRSQIADASGFRMRARACTYDDPRLIGHVTKLFFLFLPPPPPSPPAPSLRPSRRNEVRCEKRDD